MDEAFLQHIWKYGLYEKKSLQTTDGQAVEVLRAGEHNRGAGPDFIDCRVRIGQTTWAGNAEVHVKASDWFAHGHEQDKAYANVVLHIVAQNDRPVPAPGGGHIPQLVLRYDERYEENYRRLIEKREQIACNAFIGHVEPFILQHWYSVLLVERLQRKTAQIEELYQRNAQNWEETFYHILARSFGFKTNAEPMERMARSLPLKLLAKYKGDLFYTEALLFGQAGLLDEKALDGYAHALQTEYRFLKTKHGLKSIEATAWKFARMRPVSFPTVRLAQLAVLIHQSSALLSRILETGSLDGMRKLFRAEPSMYWENHYTFGKQSGRASKRLGQQAFHSIVINTIVPFLFFHADRHGNQEGKDRALDLLESVPAETNTIIKAWARCGIEAHDAFVSQALIELKNEYCIKRRCLDCQVGNQLIKML